MAYLTDGYQTLITFANYPSIKMKEVSATPPGMSGGGANDFTNMRNVSVRSKAPKKLKTMDDMSVVVHYDPDVFKATEVYKMINENQLITQTFPDGATLAIWGWVDAFAPSSLEEGTAPTATLTIICSNLNATQVETAPVYTAPSA